MRALAVALLVALAVPGAALRVGLANRRPRASAFLVRPRAADAAGQHRGIDVAGTGRRRGRAPAARRRLVRRNDARQRADAQHRTPDGYSVALTHLGSLECASRESVEEGAAVALGATRSAGSRRAVRPSRNPLDE